MDMETDCLFSAGRSQPSGSPPSATDRNHTFHERTDDIFVKAWLKISNIEINIKYNCHTST